MHRFHSVFSRPVLVRFCLTLAFTTLLSSAAVADFAAGKKAYDEKNWKGAIENLRPLAEDDDARSMVLLGNMYLEGFGVVKDPAEAFKLYQKAAYRHNTDAILATATLYRQGLGVPLSEKLAIQWFERGAKLGDQNSALFYAIYLYQGSKSTGFDFKPDHTGAYQWFKIAGKGDKNPNIKKIANQMAGNLAGKLTAAEIDKGDQFSASWKPVTPAELGPEPEKLEEAAAPKPAEEGAVKP